MSTWRRKWHSKKNRRAGAESPSAQVFLLHPLVCQLSHISRSHTHARLCVSYVLQFSFIHLWEQKKKSLPWVEKLTAYLTGALTYMLHFEYKNVRVLGCSTHSVWQCHKINGRATAQHERGWHTFITCSRGAVKHIEFKLRWSEFQALDAVSAVCWLPVVIATEGQNVAAHYTGVVFCVQWIEKS